MLSAKVQGGSAIWQEFAILAFLSVEQLFCQKIRHESPWFDEHPTFLHSGWLAFALYLVTGLTLMSTDAIMKLTAEQYEALAKNFLARVVSVPTTRTDAPSASRTA